MFGHSLPMRQFPGLVLSCFALLMFTVGRAHAAHNEPIEAQFRGCDAHACRFAIAFEDAARTQRIDVHPRGVHSADTPTRALAIRDRLNALLSNMIHQHKRIELHDVHARDDGSFDATVVVNGADVASDPLLTQLER